MNDQTSATIQPWKLFFFFVLLLIPMIAPAPLGDGHSYFYQTSVLVEQGEFKYIQPAPNGKTEVRYSPHPEGQVVLGAPFYLVGKVVGAILGADENQTQLWSVIFVSLIDISFISLALVFVALIAFRLTQNAHAALFAAVAGGFGTFFWCYSRYNFAEPATAFFLILMLFFVVRWSNEETERPRDLLYAGLAISVGIMFRMEILAAMLPVGLFVVWRRPKGFFKRWILIGLGLVPGIAMTLVANALKYGHPLNTPGTGFSFSTPFVLGANGLLFSTYKGLVFWGPIALIGLIAYTLLARKALKETVLIFAAAAMMFFVYSVYIDWSGDTSLGPRYMIVIVPLLSIPLAALWTERRVLGVAQPFVFAAVVGTLVYGAWFALINGLCDPMTLYDRSARVVSWPHFGPHYFYWKPFEHAWTVVTQGNINLIFADPARFGMSRALIIIPIAALVGAFVIGRSVFGESWRRCRQATAPLRSDKLLRAGVTALVLLSLIWVAMWAWTPSGLAAKIIAVNDAGQILHERETILPMAAFDPGAQLFDLDATDGQEMLAELNGYIYIHSSGNVFFRLYTNGIGEITVAGKPVFDVKEAKPGNLLTATVDLPLGWSPIHIRYIRRTLNPRMLLAYTTRNAPVAKEIVSQNNLRYVDPNLPSQKLLGLARSAVGLFLLIGWGAWLAVVYRKLP